jgi:hypothetical protein
MDSYFVVSLEFVSRAGEIRIVKLYLKSGVVRGMVCEYQRLPRLDLDWSYVHGCYFPFTLDCCISTHIILALWEGYRVGIYLGEMLRQEIIIGMRALSAMPWNNSFGPARPQAAITALAHEPLEILSTW